MKRSKQNRKLAAKVGRIKRRIAEGLYYPKVNPDRELLRAAMIERGKLERFALVNAYCSTVRTEEGTTIALFKDIPSVQAIRHEMRKRHMINAA